MGPAYSCHFLIFVGAIGMYFVMPKGAEDAADKDVSITMESTLMMYLLQR